MKKIIKRILAYTLDLLVIVLISSTLSNIKIINKQLDNYNEYYDELIQISTEYNNFMTDLDEYYTKELSEENYQKIIENNPNYKKYISKYYEDKKLEKDEYEKIKTESKDIYQKKYQKLYYKIEQNSTITYIIYLIIIVLYFGLFNLITNGQTIGKKIFRLKVVKKDGTEAQLINYLIRSILPYNIIYYIIAIIGIHILNQNNYYTISNIIYEIQSCIQWIIIIMIIIRTDGRGIHDLIGNTKVIALDKEGNIIKDEPIFEIKLNQQKNNLQLETEETHKNIENKRNSKTKTKNKKEVNK